MKLAKKSENDSKGVTKSLEVPALGFFLACYMYPPLQWFFTENNKEVGCCKECAPYLIALFIDTMCDCYEFGLNNPVDAYEKMKGDCKEQIDKKTNILFNRLKKII